MTEESGSGNRWELVGAPSPEARATPETVATEDTAPLARMTDEPAPRRTRRERGVLAGTAAALLLGGGALGFTGAQVAGASGDDQHQPGQQKDVRPGFGDGDRGHDRGGFDPGHDDGSTSSQDQT